MTTDSRTNVSLPAIERKDIRTMLQQHKLLQEFIGGNLKCASCGKALTDANIGAFLVRAGALTPYCSSAECLDEAVRGSRR